LAVSIAVREFTVSSSKELCAVVSSIREKESSDANLVSRVQEIIGRVKIDGDAALVDLTKEFDSPHIKSASDLKVTSAEIKNAYSKLTSEQISALKTAASQISGLVSKQKRRFLPRRYRTPLGFIVEERYVPFARIGGYVPGGLAAYPSTVLMICVTAKEADVKEIALATPPRKDGSVNEAVLVAADICGVSEILKVGGAQAIAALALGTESTRKVSLVAGPGNKYVTEAKRQVSASGDVLIDSLAGPTELLVVADNSADPTLVAEDLISQAEHGNRTLCGLVTNSGKLCEEVVFTLEGMTVRPRISQILESKLFTVLVPDEKLMAEFAQVFAPEHVEVMASNQRLTRRFTNSGLVMIGNNVPCAATDYIVGTNHILPTGGTARVSSGLAVSNFLKRILVVSASKSTIKKAAKFVPTLAAMEDLPNHGFAAVARAGEK
jgi:histidinol dehydrogenase